MIFNYILKPNETVDFLVGLKCSLNFVRSAFFTINKITIFIRVEYKREFTVQSIRYVYARTHKFLKTLEHV